MILIAFCEPFLRIAFKGLEASLECLYAIFYYISKRHYKFLESYYMTNHSVTSMNLDHNESVFTQ